MNCPTCDSATEDIGDRGSREIWLCPRCGTVRFNVWTGANWEVEDHVPKLVERCRCFEDIDPAGWSMDLWVNEGITEAINIPADRKAAQP